LAEGIHAAVRLKDAIEAFSIEAALALKDHPFDEDDGVFEADRLATASACDEAVTELLLIAQQPGVALPGKSA